MLRAILNLAFSILESIISQRSPDSFRGEEFHWVLDTPGAAVIWWLLGALNRQGKQKYTQIYINSYLQVYLSLVT